MKKAIFILFGSLILVHCTFTIAPAKVSKWRLQAFMPPADDLYSKYIAVNLVEKIKAATNGRLRLRPILVAHWYPP